jgi:hypothetical protein
MSVLVGVHGIGKQQLGRHQLLAPWSQAVADGLERARGAVVDVPKLDLAFYGDLVWPQPKEGDNKAKAANVDFFDDLDDEEVADLAVSAGELISDGELAAAEKASPTKGYTRAPGPLPSVLGALGRKFGSTAVVLFVGEFRQVRRYLRDPLIKAGVDKRVRDAVTPTCRVLIGHSLGSVVAFEFVRNNPGHRLDLLLTLGSPLGLRLVRDRMADPGHGRTAVWEVPVNVARWVNVRDMHDPVACAGDLTTWWPGVVDRHVRNQGDAHAAERYLSKRETGLAILAAVPELAP